MEICWTRDDRQACREEESLDGSAEMERFLAGIERSAFHLARVALGDADEALDVVQDAMIRLVRRYAERPTDEWKPLFYRILKNRIVDYQRRRVVRNRVVAWFPRGGGDDDDGYDPVEAAPGPEADSPDTRLEHEQAMDALESAVAELPARQQQAFLLRTIEGLNVAATAEVMGCSEGSVKTHLSRAVHSLRTTLGDYWS